MPSPPHPRRPALTTPRPGGFVSPVTGERAFLARLRSQAALSPGLAATLRLGIGDDCAILRPPPRQEIVVTTDLFLEQVHFRRDWHPPEAAGHRCLARGLSDIAAMGATPLAAFLSFALPPELVPDWAPRFLAGLLRLAAQHGVPLAGGDTAQAPASAPHALFTADIVLLGSVPRGRALLRSGARPGDAIYVTGVLGGAAAELRLLARHPDRYARMRRARHGHPHLFPTPRLAAGAFLLPLATAAIDLSDGLSTDLAHLCQASNVAAEIASARVPIHPLARRSPEPEPLALALHGGEDYELLFTAPPGQTLPASIAGTPIHRIGTILPTRRAQPQVTLLSPDGTRQPLLNLGWEHLRSV